MYDAMIRERQSLQNVRYSLRFRIAKRGTIISYRYERRIPRDTIRGRVDVLVIAISVATWYY